MKKCNKDCFNCLYPDCILKEYNTDRQRWCNRSEDYRKQQLEKEKEQYDSRKAAGLCVHCGKKATHGVRCYEHYLRNRRYNHEHRGTKRDTWQYLGKCYFCGKDVVLRRTRKGRRYYGCIDNPACSFMSWQKPSAKKCPRCGGLMLEKGNRLVCADKECGYVESRGEAEET